MKLPIRSVVLPSDLRGETNGVPDHLLAPCGVQGFKMHHLAARSMRAMVAAMTAAGFVVRATGTTRSYERQVEMFDGTDPASRTAVEGRYIPEHLWGTVPKASLTNDVRTWQGKKWKRRVGTAAAAVPGKGNHPLGLAIDFAEERDGDAQAESVSSAFVAWLVANAKSFGYSAEMQSEPWHWKYDNGDRVPDAVIAFERNQPLPSFPPPLVVEPPVITIKTPPPAPVWAPEFGQFGDLPFVPVDKKPNLFIGSGLTGGFDALFVQYLKGVLRKAGHTFLIDPSNGVYDEATAAAVRAIQGSPLVRLYPDGQINADDWFTWVDPIGLGK